MTSSPWTFDEESEPVTPGTVTLVHGGSFAITRRSGDIAPTGVRGVVVADTRICSTLVVTVNGAPVEPLAVHIVRPDLAEFIGRSADHTVVVRRRLQVGAGLRLIIELLDLARTPRAVDVDVAAATDLAGIFAVKEGQADGPVVPAICPSVAEGLVFGQGEPRGAIVRAAPNTPATSVDPITGVLRWTARLAPETTFCAEVEVVADREGVEVPFEAQTPRRPKPEPPPSVSTDIRGLALACRRAVEDLASLRLVDPRHPDDVVVAAGAPWFMTLFGRDSILTSWMALPTDPTIGLSTARTLARLQGTKFDSESEEQPGRIIHELRFSTGGSMSLDDAERYYGTADATPLFVLLVHELWRWGAPWREIEALLPAVDVALEWVAGDGDPDGDGFVEYERLNPNGLANQGWKDSWDAISFADGRLAEGPIATAEIQAYVYAAWLAGAALASASGDENLARKRRSRGDDLRSSFNERFWLPQRGWYALALDGNERPVDALASNLGHLLWCGIVPDDRTRSVADLLLSPELASGWGLRTLATSMARYDPLGYHTGSVWPHDTAIAIAGLRRAGHTDHALRMAGSLLAAAHATHGRLPELFAGLGPSDLGVPVPYPASCSPQAWASASPLLLLRVILGVEPDLPNNRIVIDPVLPEGTSRLQVQGLHVGNASLSVGVDDQGTTIEGLPHRVAVLQG